MLYPAVASAQSRLWLDVGFGIAMSADKTFSAESTFTLFGEPATFATDYNLPRGNVFGVGGGVMFSKHVGVGVNISRAKHDGDTASLFARIPHPVFFNAFAQDDADSAEMLPRRELATHFQVMVRLVDTEKLQVRVSGGPSYIKVTQAYIENFSYTQTFSFVNTTNTVTITGNDAPVNHEQAIWGYHAGGDVSYFFTNMVGVGGFFRFVAGSDMVANPLDPADQIKIRAGGTQAGVMVTFRK